MALIENWVKLEPGVRKRLHFVNHAFVDRPITDPWTKLLVVRRSLIFYVDREDGVPVSKTFSVLSEKLAGDFSGYVEEYRYRAFEFVLLKEGAGPVAPRVAEVLPYVP